jgi:predicted MFS family arabinose efflux permease
VKRHRFDPFSLVFGALFLGLAISFSLGSTIGDARHAWWPVFAILVGSALVAWAISTVLRDRRPSEPLDAPVRDRDGRRPADP